jgi:MtrB/PioB family decaheme-associated outer membrane protein
MRTSHFSRALLTLAGLAIALPVYAQDPPSILPSTDPVEIGRSQTTGKWYGQIDFGARASHVDGDEARFMRFRDLRSGIYGTNMVAGRRTQDWTLEAQGWNIGYRDQRYIVDVQGVGKLNAQFMWDQIPMFISRDTSTLYTEVQPGIFRLEDTMQQDLQAATKTLHAFEDQAVRFDLRTQRNIGSGNIVFNANKNTDLIINIRSTNRTGAIPFGGTFGFSNAVELPAPIDTHTTDVQTALEWAGTRGLFRVGWDASSFNNDIEQIVWDNPLRYGPDIDGTSSQGRMSSWADNTLSYLHATAAVNAGARSRLTGYVAFGQGKSDPNLQSFTINTAVNEPALTRQTSQAESQMSIAQLTFASRPAPRVAFNARYRYADVDIQTPIFDRPGGYVPYDSKISTPASSSAYHSVTRNNFDADAAVELAPFTSLKFGYSNVASDYQNRLWENNSEHAFRVSLDTTGNQYFSVRAQYEDRSRDGEGLQPEQLAEVGELADMRQYDVANRNRKRFTFLATANPGKLVTFNASVGTGRDEYPDSGHGLQSYDSNQYSLGFDITPDDRYDFSASYGWERYESLQKSRNAGSSTEQADPSRDWTTDYTGKVNFFETAFDINAIKKTVIRLTGDWNKSNDTYLYGLVTGSPLAAPEQLPPVKNELLRAEIDLNYEISHNLHFGAAYWYDDYNVEDFALGPTTLEGIAFPPVEPGLPPTSTNTLLLGYLYRPYTAHVGFVRLTYAW